MRTPLVLQVAGLAAVVAAVGLLAGWPWGLLAAGVFVTVIGIAGEVAARSLEPPDAR